MSNALSKKYNFWSLLKFTTPTIIMMLFMSLYTMVDGIFVSRYVGTDALSAVNIAYPLVGLVVAIGVMLATGGSAVIARKMGEKKNLEAKQNFTLIIAVGIGLAVVTTILGIIFINPLINLLGSNELTYQYCYDYILILLAFVPMAVLQMLFQCLFVTAGKPAIGLIATIVGGATNIVFDYIFIVLLDMGIGGAALATGMGYSIPAIVGLVYFSFNKKGTLRFVKPKYDGKVIFESCTNGSSEMVTNLSTAVTTLLFNTIMMKYLGSNGVAAITIILYSQYLLTALYLGYSTGIAPILSYNYGENNTIELRKLFKISMIFLIVSSTITYIASLFLSTGIVTIFASKGSEVYEIAKNGFNLFGLSYLVVGINIFASSMFTALSNGKVSAILSFVRTFLFLVAAIIFLPMVLGVNGIWLAVPIAEALSLAISLTYIVRLKTSYGYA